MQEALRLAALGLSIIPTKPGEKAAAVRWRHWRRERPSEATLRRWYAEDPERGVAVVCGGLSGVVALDSDGPQGEAAVRGKPFPPSAMLKTPRGYHWFFAHPTDRILRQHKGLRPQLDFVGEGAYSIVANGDGREWAALLSPFEAGFAPCPAWLLSWLPVELAKEPEAAPALPGLEEDADLAPWRALLPDLRWNGRQGRASCPFHDDRSPSLSVGQGNGRLRWHCFARCELTRPHHAGNLGDLQRLWRLHTAKGQGEASVVLRRVQRWIASHLAGNARTVALAVVGESADLGLDLTAPLAGFSYRRLARLTNLDQVRDDGALRFGGQAIRRALRGLSAAGVDVHRGLPDTPGARGRATALSLPEEAYRPNVHGRS